MDFYSIIHIVDVTALCCSSKANVILSSFPYIIYKQIG